LLLALPVRAKTRRQAIAPDEVLGQCAKPTIPEPAHAQLSAAKHTQKRRRLKNF